MVVAEFIIQTETIAYIQEAHTVKKGCLHCVTIQKLKPTEHFCVHVIFIDNRWVEVGGKSQTRIY